MRICVYLSVTASFLLSLQALNFVHRIKTYAISYELRPMSFIGVTPLPTAVKTIT